MSKRFQVYRFKIDCDECWPVNDPPPGSSWSSVDQASVVSGPINYSATLPVDVQLQDFWPGAYDVQAGEVGRRFGRPVSG